MRWEVLEGLRPRDAVKFVLTSEADYRWAADVIRTRRLADRTEVLLSPMHGRLAPDALVAWMLRDKLARAAQPAAPQVHLGARRSRRLTPSTPHQGPPGV